LLLVLAGKVLVLVVVVQVVCTGTLQVLLYYYQY
jgi:hypothetical protein